MIRVELVEATCASCLAIFDHTERTCVRVVAGGAELTLCTHEHAAAVRRASDAGVFARVAKTRCVCCGERDRCEVVTSASASYMKAHQKLSVCTPRCLGQLLAFHRQAEHEFVLGDALEWDPHYAPPPWWESSMKALQRQSNGLSAQRYP